MLDRSLGAHDIHSVAGTRGQSPGHPDPFDELHPLPPRHTAPANDHAATSRQFAVCPLAFHSRTRSAHFDSVPVMIDSLGPPPQTRKNGLHAGRTQLCLVSSATWVPSCDRVMRRPTPAWVQCSTVRSRIADASVGRRHGGQRGPELNDAGLEAEPDRDPVARLRRVLRADRAFGWCHDVGWRFRRFRGTLPLWDEDGQDPLPRARGSLAARPLRPSLLASVRRLGWNKCRLGNGDRRRLGVEQWG
jgi:hypothetical protein